MIPKLFVDWPDGTSDEVILEEIDDSHPGHRPYVVRKVNGNWFYCMSKYGPGYLTIQNVTLDQLRIVVE